MKKTGIIILINCLFFILIFCFSEIFSSFIIKQRTNQKPRPLFLKQLSFDEFYEENFPQKFRKPEGLNYKKRPIVLFGCSFTAGSGLETNQTFGYKLSKLSKRPIYNFSYYGWAPQHMIYLFLKEPALDEAKNPEFVIFTFIPDHINRLYSPYNIWMNNFYLSYNYDKKKDILIQNKPIFPFAYRFYTPRLMTYYFGTKNTLNYSDQNLNKNFDYLEYIFRTAKIMAEKKYPDAKFIILKYPQCENSEYFSTQRWKELEKDDFRIIDIMEFTKTKIFEERYKIPNDDHPNEKAWDTIVPELIKKLDL